MLCAIPARGGGSAGGPGSGGCCPRPPLGRRRPCRCRLGGKPLCRKHNGRRFNGRRCRRRDVVLAPAACGPIGSGRARRQREVLGPGGGCVPAGRPPWTGPTGPSALLVEWPLPLGAGAPAGRHGCRGPVRSPPPWSGRPCWAPPWSPAWGGRPPCRPPWTPPWTSCPGRPRGAYAPEVAAAALPGLARGRGLGRLRAAPEGQLAGELLVHPAAAVPRNVPLQHLPAPPWRVRWCVARHVWGAVQGPAKVRGAADRCSGGGGLTLNHRP